MGAVAAALHLVRGSSGLTGSSAEVSVLCLLLAQQYQLSAALGRVITVTLTSDDKTLD